MECWNVESPRYALATLVYPDGVASIDFSCWVGEDVVVAWEGTLYGTNGMLHFGLFPGQMRLYLVKPPPPYPAGWTSREDPPHGRAARYRYFNAYDMGNDGTGGGHPKGRESRGCNLTDGVALIEVIDAVYQPATSGAPVFLGEHVPYTSTSTIGETITPVRTVVVLHTAVVRAGYRATSLRRQ